MLFCLLNNMVLLMFVRISSLFILFHAHTMTFVCCCICMFVGKTMMAKVIKTNTFKHHMTLQISLILIVLYCLLCSQAVAHHTKAAFIRVVGSEFVQKYLGEGPRMVRDVFRLAREQSPSIIFIDEIDAIATKRFDAQTGADREVQRILIELLNQMDGFDQSTNVKVMMATNRHDTLDPALLRPGTYIHTHTHLHTCMLSSHSWILLSTLSLH